MSNTKKTGSTTGREPTTIPGMTPAVRRALSRAQATVNPGTADSDAEPATAQTPPARPSRSTAPATTKPARTAAAARRAPATRVSAGDTATRGGQTGRGGHHTGRGGRSAPSVAVSARDGARTGRGPGVVAARAARTRLPAGALRAMVADRLTERPDLEYTPTQLSNLLGRSAGAIFNALVTLCELGVAVQTSDKPRTFTLATPARRRRATRAGRAANGGTANGKRGTGNTSTGRRGGTVSAASTARGRAAAATGVTSRPTTSRATTSQSAARTRPSKTRAT